MRHTQNNWSSTSLVHPTTAPRRYAIIFRGLLALLALGFLCALPSQAWAQSLVQTTGAVTTSDQVILTGNYGATPTTGHLLVAVVGTRSTETSATLTSPGATNPTWTAVPGNDFFGLAPGQGIFYRITGAVETTNVTMTVSPTATLISMEIYEFSGIDTANPLYVFNSNFGGANPLLTDDIIPQRIPYLAVAGFAVNTSSSLGNYSAFTNTGTNLLAWTQQGDQKAGAGATPRVTIVGGFKVPVSFGTVGASTTWSQANIESWKGQIAAFNASGPTAANGSVSGTIADTHGTPVAGAVVNLSGAQDRKTITDSQGNYNFAEVETNGFYTVTPSRVNYNFAPSTHGFSALGAHTEASFGATSTGGHQTPIDTTEYFVRQQYLDFLGREPEEKGFNDWTDIINNCASGDTSCDRVHVSEMFFRSEEFQQRGYFVYRFYSTAFGQKPDYTAFAPDLGRVSGFLDATELEAAKTQFASDFTARAAFVNQYGTLSNSQYVDALSQTAGVTLSNRQALVNSLSTGTLTRAQALRQIAESGEVYARYYNQAFVVMEYFGYLKRDPDILYLNWISVLDANPADSRRMVEGFVDATEYRNRFKQ
jgi:hypothetical protein